MGVMVVVAVVVIEKSVRRTRELVPWSIRGVDCNEGFGRVLHTICANDEVGDHGLAVFERETRFRVV